VVGGRGALALTGGHGGLALAGGHGGLALAGGHGGLALAGIHQRLHGEALWYCGRRGALQCDVTRLACRPQGL
jgi:hypothetical protein